MKHGAAQEADTLYGMTVVQTQRLLLKYTSAILIHTHSLRRDISYPVKTFQCRDSLLSRD